MKYKGIYSWEFLKETCFNAIDAEWQQAKDAASKCDDESVPYERDEY